MISSFRVPMAVCVVVLGWTASAVAAPKAAPHDEVIPSDDASHACPALEAKYDRAKNAAEEEHFGNQLWAHGCRTCDDAGEAFVQYLTSEKAESLYFESSVQRLSESLQKSDVDSKAYSEAGSYDAVLVSYSKLKMEYAAVTARAEDTEARKLISELAANECEYYPDEASFAIGCSQPFGERAFAIDYSCEKIESEIRYMESEVIGTR